MSPLPFLILLDLANRLGVIVALLLLAQSPQLAAAFAAGTAILTALRALLRGHALRLETRLGWEGVVNGLRARTPAELDALQEDEAGVGLLLDAVREQAVHRTTTRPEIWAHAITLATLAVLVAHLTSWIWLLLGALGVAVVALLFRPLLRRQRDAQMRSFAALGPIARDLQALVGACAELRTAGQESGVAERLLRSVDTSAQAEREAARLSAMHAIIPALVALVASAAPADALAALADGRSLYQLGVLGAFVLSVLLGGLRLLESQRRVVPYLRAVSEVSVSRAARASAANRSPRIAALAATDLSVQHPNVARLTPHGLSFQLTRGGIAFLGPNGCGKSSALRALLGLAPAAKGRVLVDGSPLAGLEGIQGRVRYLPQRPYVDRSESLGFHLELTEQEDTHAGLRESLTRAGIGERLERLGLHTRVGELSGGELQRALIARTLWSEVGLAVLDEPEAGLDADGRKQLRDWLSEAAQKKLVVIAAHDERVVPAEFQQIRLHASPLES